MNTTRRWRSRDISACSLRLCIVMLVGISACRESERPTSPLAAIHRTVVPYSPSLADSSWDTFVFDVSISTVRFDSNGKQVAKQFLPVTYHVERTLSSSGRWRTVMTFPSRARAVVPPIKGLIDPERFEIARVEDDGDGSPMRTFNGHGLQVQSSPRGRFGDVSAAMHSAVMPTLFDRSWVQGFVFSGAGADARNALIKTKLGAPLRTSTGSDRYVMLHGKRSDTLFVDPSLGAITNVVETENGAVRNRRAITFVRNPDGSVVRTALHSVNYMTGKGMARTETTVQFDNTHFEKGN